jgi:phospho-N-acetylmuramoyl-pentapeptide-transferase
VLMHLLTPLAEDHIFFNLFRYITFRAAGGMATATLLAFLFGPRMIRWLTQLRFGQVVREEGPVSHLKKAGTPTMGGLLILISTGVATILWADIKNPYVLITLLVFLWLGTLGFLDDYLKVVQKRTEGLVARYKLIGQGLIGFLVGAILLIWPLSPIVNPNWTTLPFISDFYVRIPLALFIPWVMFIITGTSNAVNLTDGLDGLAGGLTAIAAFTFGAFAYLVGRVDSSRYLGLFYLVGSGELAVFCVALGGAALGFLWFNAHPAEVFMGDTGALALGGALGTTALLLKLEFLLAIVGGVFMLEALSVLAQVGYFKITARKYGQGRRLLLMAPLHHHFEKAGWTESKIIIRFWIVGLLCSLIAFSTLKIR